MIYGAHVILYSKDAEADRAFSREILGFKSVDAGHGWLIFALPPGEVAFHPSAENGPHELYFMCEDLEAEMASPNPSVRWQASAHGPNSGFVAGTRHYQSFFVEVEQGRRAGSADR